MKCFFFLAVLICSGWLAYAQTTDPFPFPPYSKDHPLAQQAKTARDQGNWNQSLELWQSLILRYPSEGYLYREAGIACIQLQQYDDALQYFSTAYQLDPADYDASVHLAIFYALAGREDLASFYFNLLSATLPTANGYYDYQVRYAEGFVQSWSSYNPPAAARLSQFIASLKQDHAARWSVYEREIYNQQFEVENWVKNNQVTSVLSYLQQVEKSVVNLRLPRSVYDGILLYATDWASSENQPAILRSLLSRMEEEFRHGMDNPYQEYKFAKYLATQARGKNDMETSLSYNGILLEDLAGNPAFRYLLVETYIQRIEWLSLLDRKKEALSLTDQLEATALSYQNSFLISEMFEALCIAYSDADPKKGVSYGERGLAYVKEKGLSDRSIRSALMVAYDRAGQADKALQMVAASDQTPVDFENTGTLMLNQYKYADAIPLFEKAFNGYETTIQQAKDFASRYAQVEDFYRTAQKLAYCYTQEKQHEKAFEAIERAKGSVLAAKTSRTPVKPAGLKEIQLLLGEDDALIYFIESPYEGDFMAYVVTRSFFRPIYIRSINGLRQILKRYNDQLIRIDKEMASQSLRTPTMKPMNLQTPDSDVIFNDGEFSVVVELFRRTMNPGVKDEAFEIRSLFNTLSRSLSTAIMNEVFSDLAIYKRLIIVPDGALNYIPFEALRTPLGKFMVEKYDISYIPSANVLRSLQQRASNRAAKPVLALGGAIYNKTTASPMPLKSLGDLERLRLQTMSDITIGKPVQYAYATLGYGQMNYLPGTLAEVQQIQQIVPAAKVITGDAMQEVMLKSLSKSGELKNYKVIHFATHGWTQDLIPPLSGIAMSIPQNDSKGEDGYLILSEAEKLVIQADLVMLSACQTALGKELKGEGVIGLTQAFLSAGANATISSLWPVNDYATSVLVSELYTMVFEQKIPFSEALNLVKRNFIMGVYNKDGADFTAPVYWAPFIYYGKL